jgi:aquaporin Z
VRGNFGTTWIYVIGPAMGALIGVTFERILKGRPTVAGATAAQGAQGADDSTDGQKAEQK